MKPLFSLRKREFLSPVSSRTTSYVLAEVESSRDGEYKWGHYMLTLADCRRRIQLEFFIGTLRARRESLRKINLLTKRLEEFRTALQREVGLIEQYEATQKSKPRKLKKEKSGQGKSRG
jgi:hypothetical protein